MIKKILYLILFAVPTIVCGQSLRSSQGGGGGLGHGEVFSPFKDNPKDSTKNKVVAPMEIHQWKIDGKLGNRI